MADGRKAIAKAARESLPVIDEAGTYLGMLHLSTTTDSDLPCTADIEADEPLRANDSPASLLRLLSENEGDTTAVIDRTGHLEGSIDRKKGLKMLSHLVATDELGSTISIRMRPSDYEIGKLTTIIEQNGAKILSLLTDRAADNIQTLIKIAQPDPYPTIEALERYGYDVFAYTDNAQQDDDSDILRRNYDELMKYLNN